MWFKLKRFYYKHFRKPYSVVCDKCTCRDYQTSPSEKVYHVEGLLSAKRKKKSLLSENEFAKVQILEGHLNWK